MAQKRSSPGNAGAKLSKNGKTPNKTKAPKQPTPRKTKIDANKELRQAGVTLVNIPEGMTYNEFPRSIALLEANGGWKPKGSTMHPKTLATLALLATGEASTIQQASEITNQSYSTAHKAKHSSSGKKITDRYRELIRSNAIDKAISNISDLADNAQSEAVRMRANEWLAGIGGEKPGQDQEVSSSRPVQGLGLMIIHPGALPPGGIAEVLGIEKPPLKDVTPQE